MGLKNMLSPEEINQVEKIAKLPTRLSSFKNDMNFITKDEVISLINEFGQSANANNTITTTIADLSIPTKLSELTNDCGYINNTQLPKYSKLSQFTNDCGYITYVPKKLSEFVNDLNLTISNSVSVPTKLSDFANDCGFITKADVKEKTKLSEFNNDQGFITKSAVPTVLSGFINDCGFMSENAAAKKFVTKEELKSSIPSVPTKLSELENDLVQTETHECHCYTHHIQLKSLLDDYSLNFTSEKETFKTIKEFITYLYNNKMIINNNLTIESLFIPCTGLCFTNGNANKIVHGIAVKDETTLVLVASANGIPYIIELASICITEDSFKDTIIY